MRPGRSSASASTRFFVRRGASGRAGEPESAGGSAGAGSTAGGAGLSAGEKIVLHVGHRTMAVVPSGTCRPVWHVGQVSNTGGDPAGKEKRRASGPPPVYNRASGGAHRPRVRIPDWANWATRAGTTAIAVWAR